MLALIWIQAVLSGCLLLLVTDNCISSKEIIYVYENGLHNPSILQV